MYTHSELTRTATNNAQSHSKIKSALLVAAAALALTAGRAFAADKPTLSAWQDPGSGAVSWNPDHRSPFGLKPISWNQLAPLSGTGIVSQNFTSGANTAFNSQGADDFVIPDKQFWAITEVDVTGIYFNGGGPARSFDVHIYRDAGGKPGWEVASCHQVRYGTVNVGGNLVFRIPTTIPGKCGGIDLRDAPGPWRYWVSVVANMSFANGGEWGWETITQLAQDEDGKDTKAAQWQNLNKGYGVCPNWAAMQATCIPGSGGPDYSFALQGTVVQFPGKGHSGFQFGKK